MLLLLAKVRSISRQPYYADLPSSFSLQNFDSDIFSLRNYSTNLSSNDRFAQTSVLGSDRTLKSTKLNLSTSKNTKFFTKNLNICEHKLLSNFKRTAKSTLVLPWYFEVFRVIYYIFKSCQSEVMCYQKRIIRGMDRVIEMKSVRLADGIFLVKDLEDEVR